MADAQPTDAILAVRCQLGDAAAWEALVQRWHPRLWRFVLRMIPDRATAEDVLQSVWLRVVRSMSKLRDPERLPSWLYQVARMTVADHLRTKYRREPADPLSDVPEVDAQLVHFEHHEELQSGLNQLHPIDREAVVLHYLEQLSVSDVAEVCGVAAGTIKSRLHRARQRLKHTLSPQEHSK